MRRISWHVTVCGAVGGRQQSVPLRLCVRERRCGASERAQEISRCYCCSFPVPDCAHCHNDVNFNHFLPHFRSIWSRPPPSSLEHLPVIKMDALGLSLLDGIIITRSVLCPIGTHLTFSPETACWASDATGGSAGPKKRNSTPRSLRSCRRLSKL